MAHRLEIKLNDNLPDPRGEAIKRKARDYFDLTAENVRTISVLTLDADLDAGQLEQARTEIFTNPVTQTSSYSPLSKDFDYALWVGFKPGVRDTAGSTAQEAVEDFFNIVFKPGEAIYTSQLYLINGPSLTTADAEKIVRELLSNDIIQTCRVIPKADWEPDVGIGIIIPKVVLAHEPTVTEISIQSDEELLRISDERDLALNPNDIPTIRNYFNDTDVVEQRKQVGLSLPTDVELEYIAQARSDHCNHNTFKAKFFYHDEDTGADEVVDNLFKTCIQDPTLELVEQKSWVASVLWDNAGVGRFDDDNYYTITGETHNSPSNMEAYGGSLTGIVGVYRDPMGTGLGSRLIMGTYGYCVGPRDYDGPLVPHLHPRRLLDGVIEGVRDGGNKSGIPTPFGQIFFHPSYLGKCLVFVTALGMMPVEIKGKPSEEKTTTPGDLIIMYGGRVGKDGIHGVTASSEEFGENTPAGHVQIGDPYTQKKMIDFLVEIRDEGLIQYITDNGGGGLSSSIGETAMLSDGAVVDLDKVPLKYSGLDQWEIWVSESQERMTAAIRPGDLDRVMELAKKHAVLCTVIGEYTNSGKLHLKYNGQTCAYIDLDLLESDFPQWEFDAVWSSPKSRGMIEPALETPKDLSSLMLDMLARPNICSREWVSRQYDHEVQGGSVIKPLIGVNRDTPSDAAVSSPVLGSSKGLAIAQAINPTYAAIDAYHMVSATVDEALRRLLAVGGDIEHVGGVDNFCWPNIQYSADGNPDGKLKAAHLVRANRALKEACLTYGIPLLSGKDSMYVDGNLSGPDGRRTKVSGLPTLQFTAVSVMDDVALCQTMEFKAEGDLIYVLGLTGDELGGSEYYDFKGHVGLNVPETDFVANLELYRAFSKSYASGLFASARGIYRGGLGVHLAQACFGGDLGAEIDLDLLPGELALSPDKKLFSESTGRFLVSVRPADVSAFEEIMAGLPFAKIGRVLVEKNIKANAGSNEIVNVKVEDLRAAFKRPFGDLT